MAMPKQEKHIRAYYNRLRETLEWYGNEQNHTVLSGGATHDPVHRDCGLKARTVLLQTPVLLDEGTLTDAPVAVTDAEPT